MEGRAGVPVTGASARSLGARPDWDIPIDDAGLVRPGTGGISVSPEDPRNLPTHRLPPEFGGTGKDPIWTIGEYELGEHLSYRPDPRNPKHGLIEPTHTMTFEEYQQALHGTRNRWRRVEHQ